MYSRGILINNAASDAKIVKLIIWLLGNVSMPHSMQRYSTAQSTMKRKLHIYVEICKGKKIQILVKRKKEGPL